MRKILAEAMISWFASKTVRQSDVFLPLTIIIIIISTIIILYYYYYYNNNNNNNNDDDDDDNNNNRQKKLVVVLAGRIRLTSLGRCALRFLHILFIIIITIIIVIIAIITTIHHHQVEQLWEHARLDHLVYNQETKMVVNRTGCKVIIISQVPQLYCIPK